MHGTRAATLLSLVAISVLGLASPVSAETITFTERETFTETFSDEPFVCEDKLHDHGHR